MHPCNPVAPGDCEIDVNGTPTDTVNDLTLITEYFKDYSLEVFYIESAHDVSNFEKPMIKNLERLNFQFNSGRVNYFANRLS